MCEITWETFDLTPSGVLACMQTRDMASFYYFLVQLKACSNHELVTKLLQTQDKDGNTLLHAGVLLDCHEFLLRFIELYEARWPPGLRVKNKAAQTPCQLAEAQGQFQNALQLSMASKEQCSPLIISAICACLRNSQSKDLVALLRRTADMTVEDLRAVFGWADEDGNNVLHLAVLQGSLLQVTSLCILARKQLSFFKPDEFVARKNKDALTPELLARQQRKENGPMIADVVNLTHCELLYRRKYGEPSKESKTE